LPLPTGQNPSDKEADCHQHLWYPLQHCGATVYPGALATVGPSDPRDLPASLPWNPPILPFVQGLGLCCSLSTHLHDVNTVPQFWKDLCSLEERFLKPKGFSVMGKSTNNNTTTARLLGTEARAWWVYVGDDHCRCRRPTPSLLIPVCSLTGSLGR